MNIWNSIFRKNVDNQQLKRIEKYNGSNIDEYPEPMFMRVNRKNNEVSPQNNREMLNFHITTEKLHEILAVCGELDTARSDFIRASIEFAMPVFKQHPELFEQFKNKSKEGW